jgi:hypothetical protein
MARLSEDGRNNQFNNQFVFERYRMENHTTTGGACLASHDCAAVPMFTSASPLVRSPLAVLAYGDHRTGVEMGTGASPLVRSPLADTIAGPGRKPLTITLPTL